MWLSLMYLQPVERHAAIERMADQAAGPGFVALVRLMLDEELLLRVVFGLE